MQFFSEYQSADKSKVTPIIRGKKKKKEVGLLFVCVSMQRPVRSAYHPPASSIFLSHQTSHRQSAPGRTIMWLAAASLLDWM
jgi:hypothetical protein